MSCQAFGNLSARSVAVEYAASEALQSSSLGVLREGYKWKENKVCSGNEPRVLWRKAQTIPGDILS